MGAGASVGGEGGAAAAAVEEDEAGPVSCTLQEMPEKIDEVVYVSEKWPCVIDTTEQAGRYLRYQRGSFLIAESPSDMEPEHMRKLLVGALKNGSQMAIRFMTFEGRDLSELL